MINLFYKISTLKKYMTKTAKIIIGVVVIVLIAWLGYFYKKQATQMGNTEPIKIGSIFALTGLGASQGEQELKGVQLAVKEINEAGGISGRQIELISEDVSLDKLNVAGSVAHKLVDIDKVMAIVGTTWDEPAQAILPIIEAAKVPMVGQNQTRALKKDNPFNYFFSTWYDNEVGVRELLSYAQKMRLKKVVIVRPIGAGFYQYVSDKISSNAKEFGVEIIEDINLNNPTVNDFRTDLAKIKIKKPDAVIIVLNGFTGCPFLKQAGEIIGNVPVLSTEGSGDYYALSQCSKSMENLYFSYPKETSGYALFVERYDKAFGASPSTPSVMTAYDALKIIAKSLESTNGEGGEKLQKVLAQTKSYKGVSLNDISFDELGFVATPLDAFEMRTVKDGKFVKIR